MAIERGGAQQGAHEEERSGKVKEEGNKEKTVATQGRGREQSKGRGT